MSVEGLSIRHATAADTRHIAQLTQIAGHGIPDFLWAQAAESDQSILDVGMARAASSDSNFSFQNAHIAMVREHVAGLLIGYRLSDTPEAIDPNDFPDLLRPLIELEQCVPGSYYINILASYPEFQGQGIGAAMIDRAQWIGHQLGCQMMSLQVFEENSNAVRFYRREGFSILDHRPVVPHPCYPYTGRVLLMTKAITAPD